MLWTQRCSDATRAGAEVVEGAVEGLVQIVELLLHYGLLSDWVNELHLGELPHEVTVLLAGEEHLDLGHGLLLIRALLAVGDDADAAIVELHDRLHHAQGLVQWAVVVELGEGVLLKELVLDNVGSLAKTRHRG